MESKQLEEILGYLCDTLGGDWLLAGGSLVRLVFDADRGTEDVDLMRIRHDRLSDEASRNALFRWLIDRGLGPEWVNPAMEPFVREAIGWEAELVEIRSGKMGRIFRPSITLFVYLKLRRGTPVDLGDIRVAVPKCAERFDEQKFKSWADAKTAGRLRTHQAYLGIK